MPNLTRFNPVRDVAAWDPFLDDPFEDMFRGFFRRPLSWAPRSTMEQQTAFRVDVTETEKEYRVQAEMPGVHKEDINVTIDGNEVAISAETKREKDVKDSQGAVLRSERYYGKLYRAFTLDAEVDQAGAQAKYADGVLELVLPKATPATSNKKRIAVH
jgi:HSP20 family protein